MTGFPDSSHRAVRISRGGPHQAYRPMDLLVAAEAHAEPPWPGFGTGDGDLGARSGGQLER